MLRAVLLHMLAATALGAVALAQEKKPPVPPGRDPGGPTIALVSTGIDYTLPDLASRLARDGEGELIGWDLEDNDRRPFDRGKGGAPPEWGGDGTAVATFLLGAEGVRLVPVRINPADPATLARALAFVAQTPARVAVLPMWSKKSGEWEPFRQAAMRFTQVLIIVPAGEGPEPSYPAAFGLGNVLVAEQGTDKEANVVSRGRAHNFSGARLAGAAAGAAAADLLRREAGLDVSTLRRRLAASGDGTLWKARP